ncbi:MAG: hypothetical protein ACAI34_10585, partial [Verrucomicrobium sp.]
AAIAVDDGVSVQKVDYAKLRQRLLADNAILDWTPEMQAHVEKAEKARVDKAKADKAKAAPGKKDPAPAKLRNGSHPISD